MIMFRKSKICNRMTKYVINSAKYVRNNKKILDILAASDMIKEVLILIKFNNIAA